MKSWRLYIAATLLAVPIVVFFFAGAWVLWLKGWWWRLWWILPACWGVAYLLLRRPRDVWATAADGDAHPHWTPQDEQALQLVRRQQQAVRDISPDRLIEPRFYFDTALELGHRIAQHYHPKSQDPVSSLTIPEILAAANLACSDLEQCVHDYVPASHLLTVAQWRAISKSPDWLRWAGNAAWAVSVVLNPANVARFVASRLAMDSATRQVQSNVMAWFYVTFVRHVGFYLIEMNSGRLRGGAGRYREWMRTVRNAAEVPESDDLRIEAAADETPPLEITIAVVGQLKAGKSSTINALLQSQQAATDILPLTQRVQRYSLGVSATRDRLVLLDTPGYDSDGPDEQMRREAQTAMCGADLVLLVMNVANPAREADVQSLRRFAEWFAGQRHLRPAPILGVLTHIDLLSPAMEWSPPYQWQVPSSQKERNIGDAVAHCRSLFGDQLVGVVPVCNGPPGRAEFGVQEHLMPAIAAALGQSRACALLRALHADLDKGRVGKLARQLFQLGRELVRVPVESIRSGEKRTASPGRHDSR